MLHKFHCLAAVGLLAAPTVEAATIEVTVENAMGTGSFSLTPFYVAFHDGSFDAFSNGEAASPGVELLAELGDPSGLPAERLAVDPESTAQVIGQPANGPPTLEPGESGSAIFNLDPTGGEQRFLTFLSMLVPSNDQFIGNGNPLAFEIFDNAGTFLGPQVFDITGLFAYDAGTEVNDPANGPAFTVGVDATLGTPENSVITQGQFSLSPFVALETPAGIISTRPDLTDDFAQTSLARISVREVAPVPLPAAAWLLISGLGAMAIARRRKKPLNT